MAIFELDGGQGTLVQPMRPRADAFEADSSALVTEHASDLLGEQVLTVREGGAILPWLVPLLVVLAMITLWPPLTTWLPNHVMGK